MPLRKMLDGCSCLVILVLGIAITGVNSQLDSLGFISIDCGLPANSTSVDDDTKLTYVSDDQFIDTGVNYKIASKYASTGNGPEQYGTLRSFPNGKRNCYTLRSLSAGSKYLVRAKFMFGNYDNLYKPPTFDLYLGLNYWYTVNLNSPDDARFAEIITLATSDYLQVCLVNKDLGTPFISVLELRPLETTLYRDVNSTQSLVHLFRRNIGASDQLVRYPNDPYDRFWRNYTLDTWSSISTNSIVQPDPDYATPSIVMQTAATTSSTNQSLDISWTGDNESVEFLIILHIGEIQDIPRTDYREFNILSQNPLFSHVFAPSNLTSGWARYMDTGRTAYYTSLKATSKSTLPPILNAIELYVITPATGIPTYIADIIAIDAIKENYKMTIGWNGDPCVPIDYAWTGLGCTIYSNVPRITHLNLSSAGLTGELISSFGNLTALVSLDLSGNDLSGVLGTYLDQLVALTYLDITGNKNISSMLPPGLQKKQQDGTLTFKSKLGDFTQQSKKKKAAVVIIAVVGAVVLLLLAVAIILVFCLRKRPDNQIYIPKPNENTGSSPLRNSNAGSFAYNPAANGFHGNNAGKNYTNISKPRGSGEGMLNFENRQFTYNDLNKITNSFQDNIGTGGFGSVYAGLLENGTQVAVKMRSHTSSQGVKEFLAEAQNLTRVHHKNLVSLLGYSMDGDCMALVYEYMPEGTLQDKLRDNGRSLTWKQRLRVAWESAQGLEYLHKSCNPPLIHRDVKTNNILLNSNLDAKIADFGLSRAFNNANSHVSTAVVGTLGYLDPEYSQSCQLSRKSDVYGFGVVLLEIITGKPPIIAGPEGGHLAKWVSQKLPKGDIESIVDPRMHGQYDINSVWKVTELARKCTEHSSVQRPTMSVVVAELKESLDLEISTEGNPYNYSRNDNFMSDVSQNGIFEMDYMDGMTAPGPTAK
ncbi:Leucine-rich repeat protein kinase family protein [Rhynchospora pubera]|uniref:non-specific serine/threonine protein kinase n=1 Tax=Rhynchospora pubera TaxID=906938 RepID=A0AAV8GRC3_9POAL|nr:Leucine-rich repeat protein kinase family protein [Rhynchospora pubera]